MGYAAGSILRSKVTYCSLGTGLAAANLHRLKEQFPEPHLTGDVTTIPLTTGQGKFLELHLGQKLRDYFLEWFLYSVDSAVVPTELVDAGILFKGVDAIVLAVDPARDREATVASYHDTLRSLITSFGSVPEESVGLMLQIASASDDGHYLNEIRHYFTVLFEDPRHSASTTAKAAMAAALRVQTK